MKRVSHRSALRKPALLGTIGVRIWTDEHGAWWRPNGQGYTTHLEAAGFYTPADALAHTAGLDPSKKIGFGVHEDLDIVFSGPMVRGLLEGRKIMTRRLAWTQRRCPVCAGAGYTQDRPDQGCTNCGPDGLVTRRSRWQRVRAGDRLWVREAWRAGAGYDDVKPSALPPPWKTKINLWYEADKSAPRGAGKLRPSFFMPRWMSRITLHVTATRMEKLQAITNADARHEGVVFETADPPFYYVPEVYPHNLTAVEIRDGERMCFANLWKHLHGVHAWAADPDVIPITFNVDRRNIDMLREAA